MNEYSGIVIFLTIAGLALIGIGIGARLGYFKTLYLVKGISGLYPSGYIYAFVPAGIGFLLLAFIMLSPDRRLAQDIVIYGLSSLLLLSIILMTWKPKWLKPWWLRWLEEHYGHVFEDMLEEARNTRDFEQQTPTEVDLAIWADSIAQKRGWQRLR